MIDRNTNVEDSTSARLTQNPCYVQPFSEVFNEDCIQVMKRYPDKFFDLAVVDPPYGIDWMKQIQNPNTKANWKTYENKEWDKQIPPPEYWDELFRVSKNQIVWGGNYMTEYLKPKPCWLIWDKMQ